MCLTVESGEAEHADLLGDVVPGPWGAQSLQLGLQLVPHQQHPVGHGLHVALPAGSRGVTRGHAQCMRVAGHYAALVIIRAGVGTSWF